YKYYKEKEEGDKAKNCADKILGVPQMLTQLKADTDERGILYGRKQNFKLDKKYRKIIKSYKN
ncbi:MAG: hypothetical protein ACI4RR_03725, partial [Eubacterium sp.]